MNNYISLRVDAVPCCADITDLLAAFLAEKGYESFVADDAGMTAYIPEKDFNEEDVDDALKDFPIPTSLTYTTEHIEGRDWNEEWEKNYFKPILIDDKCLIHASFHHDLPQAQYDILIDPRMAFGTGHHSTTASIIRYLLEADLAGKSVIDMGTGTGILAILCAMRGASPVTGIEIDPAAYENAVDNAGLNSVDIRLIRGDAASLADVESADFFIANINRNIILADLGAYASRLVSGGTMILSGFYKADLPLLEKAAVRYGLVAIDTKSDNDWTALRLRKE